MAITQTIIVLVSVLVGYAFGLANVNKRDDR
jgi:hypothetical protein